MPRTRIVTDAAAYLSPELIAEHKITVLPFEARIGDEKYLVGPGDNARQFFERLALGVNRQPQITIPLAQLERVYDQLHRVADEILFIASSRKLSNAFAKAEAASRAFLGRCKIMVVDSMATSWGLGLLVETAARAAAQQASLDGIVRVIRGIIPHIYVVCFVERLDFLERGGRIGVAQAMLGTMLRIRPILLVEGGDVVPLEKARTRDLALDKLADFVAEFAAIQKVVIMRSPLNGESELLVGELKQRLSEILPNQRLPVVDYDPVLACHIGPQALGAVVYEGL